MPSKEELTVRDHLEQKDPEKLSGQEHIALALYTLCDVLMDYFSGGLDDLEDDEEDEDDDR